MLGWWLCHQPGMFLGAFHHAVWRSPSGDLFDLEEVDLDDRSIFVTFLPDPTPLDLISPEPQDDRQTLLARPREPQFLRLDASAIADDMASQFGEQVRGEARHLRVPVLREFHDAMLGKGAWLRAILKPPESN